MRFLLAAALSLGAALLANSATAQPSLKIDRARYVLTVDQQRRIIRDGSILVERGRITRVGKADDLADALEVGHLSH